MGTRRGEEEEVKEKEEKQVEEELKEGGGRFGWGGEKDEESSYCYISHNQYSCLPVNKLADINLSCYRKYNKTYMYIISSSIQYINYIKHTYRG